MHINGKKKTFAFSVVRESRFLIRTYFWYFEVKTVMYFLFFFTKTFCLRYCTCLVPCTPSSEEKRRTFFNFHDRCILSPAPKTWGSCMYDKAWPTRTWTHRNRIKQSMTWKYIYLTITEHDKKTYWCILEYPKKVLIVLVQIPVLLRNFGCHCTALYFA